MDSGSSGFANAARRVAVSIEARWPGCRVAVLWSAPERVDVLSGGILGSVAQLDLTDESDLLTAAVRAAAGASPNSALDAIASKDALVLPIVVDGKRDAALCVLSVPAFEPHRDGAVVEAFVSLLATIREGELERERLVNEVDALRREARTDPLTELLNRRGFLLELERHCGQPTDRENGAVLLLADIRGLKDANDRYGHTVGDQLLVDVAHALRAIASPGDVLGRFGGDEFAVIVCGDSPDGRADAYAADVQARLDRLRKERPASLTVAFGQQSLADVSSAAEALERADDAMYHRLA